MPDKRYKLREISDVTAFRWNGWKAKDNPLCLASPCGHADDFTICQACNKPMRDHAVIKLPATGIRSLVCPGDWIVTNIATGRTYPISNKDFTHDFEEVDSEQSVPGI